MSTEHLIPHNDKSAGVEGDMGIASAEPGTRYRKIVFNFRLTYTDPVFFTISGGKCTLPGEKPRYVLADFPRGGRVLGYDAIYLMDPQDYHSLMSDILSFCQQNLKGEIFLDLRLGEDCYKCTGYPMAVSTHWENLEELVESDFKEFTVVVKYKSDTPKPSVRERLDDLAEGVRNVEAERKKLAKILEVQGRQLETFAQALEDKNEEDEEDENEEDESEEDENEEDESMEDEDQDEEQP